MIFTNSDELWNNDAPVIEQAGVYLAGTHLTWRELLPEVGEALEVYWPNVVRRAEALLKRQQLSGEEATAVVEAD
jgi:hypothetical protein